MQLYTSLKIYLGLCQAGGVTEGAGAHTQWKEESTALPLGTSTAAKEV